MSEEHVRTGLREALETLLRSCSNGRKCRHGEYVVGNNVIGYTIHKELLNDDTVVLSQIASRTRSNVISVSFVINTTESKITNTVMKRLISVISSPIRVVRRKPRIHLPEDLDSCSGYLCVDGFNTTIGDYKKYFFNRYALVKKSVGNRVYGVLFIVVNR